jgi:hypothetical protein
MKKLYARIEKDGYLVISIAVKNGGMMPAIPSGCTLRLEWRIL